VITSHQILEQRARDLLPCLVAQSFQSPPPGTHVFRGNHSSLIGNHGGLIKEFPINVPAKGSKWLFQWQDQSINLLRLELEIPEGCDIYYVDQGAKCVPRFSPVSDLNQFLVEGMRSTTWYTQAIWLTRVAPPRAWHSLVLVWHPLRAGDFIVC
jgi:hypothetical protein